MATGFGLGLSPYMPGTVGTLLGLPLCYGLELAGGRPMFQIIACILLLLVGIPICRAGEVHFGKKDPGSVVFDEIAAMPLIFILIPFTWTNGLIGFIWFRVFDIIKPWPIRNFERVSGGLGIMIDDTIAGLMAAAVTWLTVRYLGNTLMPSVASSCFEILQFAI